MANRANILGKSICVGDVIKVHQKVKEKDKERIQVFSGIVIKIKGAGINKSFTVRKISTGRIGIERIWPVNSPWLTKIEVTKRGKVKRAKLYYLRKKLGRKATRVKTVQQKKALSSQVSKKSKKLDAEKKPRKSGRKSSPKVSSK